VRISWRAFHTSRAFRIVVSPCAGFEKNLRPSSAHATICAAFTSGMSNSAASFSGSLCMESVRSPYSLRILEAIDITSSFLVPVFKTTAMSSDTERASGP
jgi:hypothetical protein